MISDPVSWSTCSDPPLMTHTDVELKKSLRTIKISTNTRRTDVAIISRIQSLSFGQCLTPYYCSIERPIDQLRNST